MDLSIMTPKQRSLAERVIDKCVISREFFIREILRVQYIEDWQLDTIRDLDRGETKISIRSGHGVGKTALCSWLALHFLLFRDDVKVIVTSPSFKQLTDGLIPEITKWISRMPEWMQIQVDVTQDRVVRKPSTKNNFISFRTARKENPEALQGIHAAHVLIIVDEASGVDEVVYEAGQGALSTPGALCVLIGNPTRPYGFFHKTQTVLRDLWLCKRVSCEDSSRVDRKYIEAQARTYGIDSREYKVRVLGDFPEAGADTVIPRSYVESAIGREIERVPGAIVWGVDPGRGGDPSGFLERTSNEITDARELRYDDLMRLTGWVKSQWDKLPPRMQPKHIFVDSIGLGAGVADRLLELGLPVVHVNVSEAAAMNERYARLRAEIWYETRHWFESREVSIDASLPHEVLEKLTNELCSIEQKIMSNGKVDLESKDDMKRRGLKSPNMADALALTFAMGGAVGIGAYSVDGWGDAKTLSYTAPHVV
jgi:phage terminase large subunit